MNKVTPFNFDEDNPPWFENAYYNGNALPSCTFVGRTLHYGHCLEVIVPASGPEQPWHLVLWDSDPQGEVPSTALILIPYKNSADALMAWYLAE